MIDLQTEKNQGNKQRNAAFDIIRSLGIIMVLIAHVIYGGEGLVYLHIKGFLYSGFLVCLFFVLGGFLIKKEAGKYSAKKFIVNKFNRLFIPSLSYILFYIVSNFSVYGTLKLLGLSAFFPHTKLQHIALKDLILAILMANDARFTAAGVFGMLYFLPAYFIANILFFCFISIKQEKAKYLFFLSSPLAAIMFTRMTGYANIPWGINIALLMIPMMCLGSGYDKIEAVLSWIKKMHAVVLVAGILCSLIIINYFKLHSGTVHNCDIENIFVFYSLAVLGFLSCCGVALFINGSFLSNVFIAIGKYTLPIYGFHVLVLDFYRIFLYRFLYQIGLQDFYNQHPWFFYIIYVVFSIPLIIFISKTVIEKNRLLRRMFLGMA